ncbi:two-component system histidine kinase PnpS [Paenibacillus sp. MMS18-CY102]|uniref:two-component system histidine kinase PnpS n=1 Tax=Paenibacillus sp. MMS18-CY102 TaxID=2682849 RepID=UPI0013665570|nr:ATP-binding protein [Paenibacillus sp. MMS18-CY102]MWC28583.1 HAMP domain-containing protein [Paenibacillus sp. MMS18-CY102]
MNHFRTRLTLIMIALIGLSVLASGLIMAQTFKRNHIHALEESMVREIHIIASNTQWASDNVELGSQYSYYTEIAKSLKKDAGSRVTFIRADGVVLGDSDHDPHGMDNHLQRVEVQQALHEGVGRGIRLSDTVNQNMLYVAVPITKGNHQYFIRLAMSLQDVEQSVRDLWTALIIWLLVLFVVAALVSYRIALGMTRPLEQITKVAKRIQRMDYLARVEVKKNDEIGDLGYAINAMADSLQVQMERIRQNESQLESVLDNMINGIIMIDRSGHIVLLSRRAEEILGISAREMVGRHYTEARQQHELSQLISEAFDKQAYIHEEMTFYYPEERLLELNIVPMLQDNDDFVGVLLVLQDVSAIRRLERMRSEFVANVSHELKTPVAAVKGFAETLLGGAVNDEETARSFLQIIYDESERLNRLIGDILELSKIESRRVPLMLSPVEMDYFAAKTVQLMEAEATRKGITLELKADGEIYVEADEDRLRQIMMNLLSNGINYTPEGGKVTVTVEPVWPASTGVSLLTDEGRDDYDRIRITIKDTGIGIPKKDLPRIFERFYRVDKARSRSSGGTGLGLSIVKHLVEMHNGSIAVESEVGVGTKFIIELPVLHP